jgi:hypothetical protein
VFIVASNKWHREKYGTGIIENSPVYRDVDYLDSRIVIERIDVSPLNMYPLHFKCMPSDELISPR